MTRVEKLREMRQRTGASLRGCVEALEACGGDVDAACEHQAVRIKNSRTPTGVSW